MTNIKGLLVPLITPMYHGSFDDESMAKLITNVDQYVDGYVPCLSSGEGAVMADDLWQEVVSSVRAKTKKPVIAGIKRPEIKEIIKLAGLAEKIGCEAVILPAPFNTDEKNVKFFKAISAEISLPIIIYNTETNCIQSAKAIQEIDGLKNIIAIKDSSMNINLFQELIDLKTKGEIKLNIFQGMEHLLLPSKGCDGFLISLLNVEPKLCKDMLENFSAEINSEILNKFQEYNLGGEWYITLKALLYGRNVIRSAEQVNPAIKI